MGLLTTIADFMRQYHYFHGALHALERASARQLADMGIERADSRRVGLGRGGAPDRPGGADRSSGRIGNSTAGSLELGFAGQH